MTDCGNGPILKDITFMGKSFMTQAKELLAPAGDIEAGYAALYYGADAVYLGLQKFSARATAENFDEAALSEFTAYAHSLKRKVFVAVNTLVLENELVDLLENLDICSRCQVDAVIIQDLGVARIVREQYPELEMHASTQMAVHNKEGALSLQELGFSRVVVARELTLAEIKEITAIPGLETEAFIHGALCYSYSGLCLFSSLETGKSANRGKCLYPCRQTFSGIDGEKHLFSMKDMALENDVLKMPVTSLKIEGRKKSALYVAAVTDYYRRILDGLGADALRAENIQQIFSRPWTKFHFNGKNKEVVDRDFVGHRGLFIGKVEQYQKGRLSFRTNHAIERYDGMQIDVMGEEKPFGFSVQAMKVNGKSAFKAEAGDLVEIMLPFQAPKIEKGWSIYLSASTIVKNSYPYTKPRPKEFKAVVDVDVMVKITETEVMALANGVENHLLGTFTPATNPEKMKKAIEDAFAKTGNMPFELGKLEIDNPQNLFVPLSLLNELRRSLYDKIEIEHKSGLLPPISKHEVKEPQWIIKTDDLSVLDKLDLDDFAEIIWAPGIDSELDDIRKLPKNKVRIALPAVCRHPKMYQSLIASLLGQGYKKWEIGNYWGLAVLPETGLDLSFDTSLYMMNSQAVAMAKDIGAVRITAATEDMMANLKTWMANSSLATVMVVYLDVPLFTSANCIRSSSCKDCVRGEKWLNLERGGQKYQALSKDCQIVLFSDSPLCLAAEAKNIPVDYYRVDFVGKKYNAEQAAAIWNKVSKFEDVNACLKGNIARKML